jgi:hypothetical protein
LSSSRVDGWTNGVELRRSSFQAVETSKFTTSLMIYELRFAIH